MLVRWCVAYSETVQGITRPAGSVVILPHDPEYMLDQLNRLIEWRATLKNGEVVRANAPRQVASILLSRHGDWRAQPLIAAINAPTLRPDGSLLDREGYDARTGLLFVNAGGEAFPSIPARPTRPEAFAALANLKEVIGEFPFAAEHDRSAALSAIITATVRHALKAAPMHVLSAPRMASGKSLLADVVALVATGRTATVMSFTSDPEEMRKRVLAVLLAGDGVVSLDNIESVLASSVLCTVLTQESFSDRLLGANKRATVPTLTFWLATGNNLQVAGDLTTRIVPCNLDPQVERPEEREFERNLYDWIPRNRARLVMAILTLLRAYVAAGLPKQNLKNFARFEDWSRLVRSALVWLGEPDPLLGLERVEDADPDRIRLRSLLLGWYAAFQGRPVTSKAAMELAYPDRVRMARIGEDSTPRASSILAEVLDECFAHRKGGVTSSQIGYFLRKYAGRIEVGARFGRGGSSQRRELWQVEVLDSERFHRELYAFTTSGENPHLSSLSSLPAPSAPAPSVPEAADCANQEPVTEDLEAVEVEWEVF
ncbi:MAG: hypothetical protein EA420_01140 [Candidatus Competibacteraceae bacterium]|nr:MAG: hypothetical protein EA420_01140 [Candidatus Competibacteraceae bacterium]